MCRIRKKSFGDGGTNDFDDDDDDDEKVESKKGEERE